MPLDRSPRRYTREHKTNLRSKDCWQMTGYPYLNPVR
jgi:hypothetical protein